MPVRAYVGEPRSGKTYELASVVILNALKQGRRVVSNIAGLDYAAYVELIRSENPNIENIGSIVNLQHEEVKKPDFWLTDINANTERHDRQIQRGDFLVLDEIWRFWDGFSRADSEGNKRPESVMNFFRMHGQMPHPKTGLICEISLITQDIQDINRSVKNIITQTYLTTKLTSLGLTKRYRLDIYNKHYTSRKPISSYQKEYNPKFFNLYKSHSAKQEGDADAVEISTDKRGNILKGKIFLMLLVLIVLGVFAAKMLWGFFHPVSKTDKPVSVVTNKDVNAVSAAEAITPQVTTSAWHIVGFYKLRDLPVLLLKNDNGSFRHVIKFDSLSIAGLAIEAVVDGETVNNWSLPNQTIQGSLNAPTP